MPHNDTQSAMAHPTTVYVLTAIRCPYIRSWFLYPCRQMARSLSDKGTSNLWSIKRSVIRSAFPNRECAFTGIAAQRQTAVTAYLKSKRLPLFFFARQRSGFVRVDCPDAAFSQMFGGYNAFQIFHWRRPRMPLLEYLTTAILWLSLLQQLVGRFAI